MTEGSLDALLDRLCRGDVAAAEQVFRAYEPYLRKVVRRQLPSRLRSRFDSVDIVQSAWRDLLHGFREAGWRFATTAQLQAFLVKVTRNRFIDRCRQHSPAVAREQPLMEGDFGDGPALNQLEPPDVVQADDLWTRMLTLCPPEHRQLLHLKRAGHSLSDIAASTGLHVGSVRRILRELALRLAQDYPDTFS